MGKLNAFLINFTKRPAVYFGGDLVEGYVLVDLKEPMRIRSIKLNLLGRSKVHWTQTRYQGKTTRYINYESQECYFNTNLILFGSESGDAQEHPAGRHEHRFHFNIPTNVPSSFEGEYGYVRYTASAALDRPWKFDHDTKRAFTVLSHMDLNCLQGISNPQQGTKHVEVSCCCCVSGELAVVFRINKRGFVPGENLIVYAEIRNKSNTDIKAPVVEIYQSTEFYGVSDAIFSSQQMKPKTVERLVLTKTGSAVAEGQTTYWEHVPVKIPSLPPSELPHCDNIKIAYTLSFVVPNPYGNDVKMSLPLVIGTIPIREVITTQPVSQDAIDPSAPPPYEPPPPSYEECALGEVNILDEGDSEYMLGQLSYAPVYPTYSLPPHHQSPPPPYQEISHL